MVGFIVSWQSRRGDWWEAQGLSTLEGWSSNLETRVVKTAPTSYRLEASNVRHGVSAATSKQTTIEFDTSASGSEVLPGPADLLTMAFAACMLKNVERFSELLRFSCQEASIKVESERQDTPPKMTKITYSLHLVTDEPQHRVDLLHRNIKQHGTIYNTLAAVCEVSGEVSVRRSDDAAIALSGASRQPV